MLQSHFQFKTGDKQSILRTGGLISALVFVALVGLVLYRSLSTALFKSERASAFGVPQIQDAQLKKALELAEKWEQTRSQAPTEQPVVTVTPSPAELRIVVRNGTSIPGLASETADKLREAGFTQIVEVTNAEGANFKTSVIQIKKSLDSYLTDLRDALALSADSVEVAELQETEEFDIVVIVGREGR